MKILKTIALVMVLAIAGSIAKVNAASDLKKENGETFEKGKHEGKGKHHNKNQKKKHKRHAKGQNLKHEQAGVFTK